MPFHLIVATDQYHQIGYQNNLIYPIPHDLSFFSQVTSGVVNGTETKTVKNAIVMGHNTWKSLPPMKKPLQNRLNVVLSHDQMSVDRGEDPDNLVKIGTDFGKILTGLEQMQSRGELGDIFVIGGSSLYQLALLDSRLDKIYVTHVNGFDVTKDDETRSESVTTFPELHDYLKSMQPVWYSDFYRYQLARGVFKDQFVTYQFRVYQNKKEDLFSRTLDTMTTQKIFSSVKCAPVNLEEQQYLDLLKKVVEQGDCRVGRNGNTRSIFGVRMEFNLENGRIPLLTTKKMAWKTVIKELLWFLSGDTSAKTLQNQKVRIWDGNSSREYLDSIGLTDREVGDLGPVYGFQWRHFGAEYKTCHEDYTGQGVDQIAECLRQIREAPTSRRILFCGWNPRDMSQMALPPCHLLCQFFVDSGDRLSLQLYQRSGDSFLGIPFNIFSYCVLLLMFCQLTGKKPGRFIHIVGDFHVYENHLEAVNTQLSRTPRYFPKLEITSREKLEDYSIDDFELVDYHCYGGIKAPMAA